MYKAQDVPTVEVATGVAQFMLSCGVGKPIDLSLNSNLRRRKNIRVHSERHQSHPIQKRTTTSSEPHHSEYFSPSDDEDNEGNGGFATGPFAMELGAQVYGAVKLPPAMSQDLQSGYGFIKILRRVVLSGVTETRNELFRFAPLAEAEALKMKSYGSSVKSERAKLIKARAPRDLQQKYHALRGIREELEDQILLYADQAQHHEQLLQRVQHPDLNDGSAGTTALGYPGPISNDLHALHARELHDRWTVVGGILEDLTGFGIAEDRLERILCGDLSQSVSLAVTILHQVQPSLFSQQSPPQQQQQYSPSPTNNKQYEQQVSADDGSTRTAQEVFQEILSSSPPRQQGEMIQSYQQYVQRHHLEEEVGDMHFRVDEAAPSAVAVPQQEQAPLPSDAVQHPPVRFREVTDDIGQHAESSKTSKPKPKTLGGELSGPVQKQQKEKRTSPNRTGGGGGSPTTTTSPSRQREEGKKLISSDAMVFSKEDYGVEKRKRLEERKRVELAKIAAAQKGKKLPVSDRPAGGVKLTPIQDRPKPKTADRSRDPLPVEDDDDEHYFNFKTKQNKEHHQQRPGKPTYGGGSTTPPPAPRQRHNSLPKLDDDRAVLNAMSNRRDFLKDVRHETGGDGLYNQPQQQQLFSEVFLKHYINRVVRIQAFLRYCLSAYERYDRILFLNSVRMFQARYRLLKVLRSQRRRVNNMDIHSQLAFRHRCRPILEQLEVRWAHRHALTDQLAWKFMDLLCPTCLAKGNATISQKLPDIVVLGDGAEWREDEFLSNDPWEGDEAHHVDDEQDGSGHSPSPRSHSRQSSPSVERTPSSSRRRQHGSISPTLEETSTLNLHQLASKGNDEEASAAPVPQESPSLQLAEKDDDFVAASTPKEGELASSFTTASQEQRSSTSLASTATPSVFADTIGQRVRNIEYHRGNQGALKASIVYVQACARARSSTRMRNTMKHQISRLEFEILSTPMRRFYVSLFMLVFIGKMQPRRFRAKRKEEYLIVYTDPVVKKKVDYTCHRCGPILHSFINHIQWDHSPSVVNSYATVTCPPCLEVVNILIKRKQRKCFHTRDVSLFTILAIVKMWPGLGRRSRYPLSYKWITRLERRRKGGNADRFIFAYSPHPLHQRPQKVNNKGKSADLEWMLQAAQTQSKLNKDIAVNLALAARLRGPLGFGCVETLIDKHFKHNHPCLPYSAPETAPASPPPPCARCYSILVAYAHRRANILLSLDPNTVVEATRNPLLHGSLALRLSDGDEPQLAMDGTVWESVMCPTCLHDGGLLQNLVAPLVDRYCNKVFSICLRAAFRMVYRIRSARNAESWNSLVDGQRPEFQGVSSALRSHQGQWCSICHCIVSLLFLPGCIGKGSIRSFSAIEHTVQNLIRFRTSNSVASSSVAPGHPQECAANIESILKRRLTKWRLGLLFHVGKALGRWLSACRHRQSAQRLKRWRASELGLQVFGDAIMKSDRYSIIVEPLAWRFEHLIPAAQVSQSLVLDIRQRSKKDYDAEFTSLVSSSHIQNYLGMAVLEPCEGALQSAIHLYCERRRRLRLQQYQHLAEEELDRFPKHEDPAVKGSCTEGFFEHCKKEYNTAAQQLIASARSGTDIDGLHNVHNTHKKRFCDSCAGKLHSLTVKLCEFSSTTAWIKKQCSQPLDAPQPHKRTVQ